MLSNHHLVTSLFFADSFSNFSSFPMLAFSNQTLLTYWIFISTNNRRTTHPIQLIWWLGQQHDDTLKCFSISVGFLINNRLFFDTVYLKKSVPIRASLSRLDVDFLFLFKVLQKRLFNDQNADEIRLLHSYLAEFFQKQPSFINFAIRQIPFHLEKAKMYKEMIDFLRSTNSRGVSSDERRTYLQVSKSIHANYIVV